MRYRKKGDLNYAKDHNDLIREINRLKSTQQDNLWYHPYSPGGITETPALQIIQGTEASKFQISSGRVNYQVPTLGGTALNATTPPEITVAADVWVYIKVVGTFADPDSYVITIETEASATFPTGTDITASGFVSFFYIGKVDFTSGTPDTYAITNNHTGGNLGLESWGNVNLWFKV